MRQSFCSTSIQRQATALANTSTSQAADVYVRPSSRSPAAIFGSCQLGQIVLPVEIQDLINSHINASDKNLLRNNALDLFKFMRTSSHAPSGNSKRREKIDSARPKNDLPPFNKDVALAYAAAVMPSVYAATLHVLQELSKKMRVLSDDWRPEHLIDFGSGTSSAALAALSVWPALDRYTAIDDAQAMNELATRILNASHPTIPSTEWHHTNLKEFQPASLDTSADNTVAISAFTFSEIPHSKVRDKILDKIWATPAQVYVFIERGTPAGFALIADIRAKLLKKGRSKPSGSEQSYVMAPCPHDGSCPLRFTKDFCHFSQKLQRPNYLMKTKHSKIGEEDSKFSYVIIKRGSRPQPEIGDAQLAESKQGPLTHTKAQATVVHEVEDASKIPLYEAEEETSSASSIEYSEQNQRDLERDSFNWPRLVAPPMKRSGHIIMDACAKSGHIERFTIPKSQGKQAYHDARKARWGDAFPHASKNKSQIRDRGVRRLTQTQYDEVSPEEFDELLLQEVQQSNRNSVNVNTVH